MSQKTGIVFMGTPEFAVPSLDVLYSNGYNIAAVVTAPDKPSGRGLRLRQSAVKQYATENGLKVLQPENLKEPDFISELQKLNPDIIVVVAFRMLPEAVWKIPALGTFNLHASLLPQYRGAAPINHAIMNGESETGCTSFLIDHEIDTGKILLQEKCKINPEDDAGSMHDKLMITGKELVLKTAKGLEEKSLKPLKQSQFYTNGESLKTAPKLFKHHCIINWNKSGKEISNLIRGLSPFPGAFTVLKLKKSGKETILKIFKADFIPNKESTAGEIICENLTQLLFGCTNGHIAVREVQLEGKKRMDTPSFLRGFSIDDCEISA